MCENENNCGHDHGLKKCSCREQTLKLEGFLVPCLLLLLKESSAHGYHLIERLSKLPFLFTVPDPAVVYRRLRCLEEDGFIESRLEEGTGGPARKVYSLTKEGEAYLQDWVPIIAAQKESLGGFLKIFKDIDDRGQ
ncbi:MAG: helix-turn-helix transcriptional regulator [Bacillota bacterium]